jgi:branched-chain amino acid transport system substrate-binding protein
VFAAVAVVAVAACSSSKASSSSSSSSTQAPSSTAQGTGSGAQATGTPIKVGAICYCSSGAGGLGAVFAPGLDVYKAWANTVNSSGGIDGHPVQLITKDDGGSPSTSVADAQALIADHVVAIADMTTVDQAWASTVEAAKIPVVGVLTYETPFGTNPDFYPEAQTNNSSIYAVVTTAKAAGATSLANVYCAEAPVCAESVPAYAATGKQLGVPVTYNAEILATAPNYTAQCLAAQQKNVGAVFIGEPAAITVKFAGSCAQQNYKPTYVTEGFGFGMNVAAAPGLSNTLWSEFGSLPFFANTPAVAAADAAIDKYYPGVRENATLYSQQDFMSWASGMLLVDAIKAGGASSGGAVTAAEVVKGLESLKGDTVDGLTPPLTFQPGQPHNVDCWFTARVQNATPSMQNNSAVSCQNGSSS